MSDEPDLKVTLVAMTGPGVGRPRFHTQRQSRRTFNSWNMLQNRSGEEATKIKIASYLYFTPDPESGNRPFTQRMSTRDFTLVHMSHESDLEITLVGTTDVGSGNRVFTHRDRRRRTLDSQNMVHDLEEKVTKIRVASTTTCPKSGNCLFPHGASRRNLASQDMTHAPH